MQKKRLIGIFVLCCYFAAVLILCMAKPQQIPLLEEVLWGIKADKIVHFLMFMPYPMIAYNAFRPDGGEKWRDLTVLAAVFAAGIGAAMATELLQGISEYRSYETEDFYADVLGMMSCVFVMTLFIILKKRNRNTDL